jgi:chorismate mutase
MLRGIRGAITVEKNKKAEIVAAASQLLSEMARQNKVSIADVASIIFSATPDLNAEFPAKAVRELGWNSVPRMCAQEINVPDGLKKCIRILMHINTRKNQKRIKHVYLEGASKLRMEG